MPSTASISPRMNCRATEEKGGMAKPNMASLINLIPYAAKIPGITSINSAIIFFKSSPHIFVIF